MFTLISAAHLLLVGFGLWRMRARPRAQQRTPYVYSPRTSFLIGRLTGRQREPRQQDNDRG